MIVWFVVFCHILVLSSGAIIQPSCSAANDVLDSVLNMSNTRMNESYSNVEPEDDFQVQLPVFLLGIRLPWMVSFKVSDGSMKPFASLSRSNDADAVLCLTPIMRTLEAQLKYDNIIFSFKTVKAKFLFLEMTGSVLYNIGPVKFDIAIAKGTTLGPPQGPTCSLEAYKLVNAGTKNLKITSDSWASWFFNALISDSLLDEKVVPALGDYVQTSTWNIYTFFAQDWCHTVWKDDI